MLQFQPQNLNLDEVLQTNPPAFKYHKDCFVHIINLLIELPGRKKELLEGKGYVPLNGQLLKKRVHNYSHYLKYLTELGIIQCDGFYIPGEKSRAYRFTEKYCTQVVATSIKKNTLKKAINNKGNYERGMLAKYNFLYKWLEGIQIDFEAAKGYLDRKFEQEKQENYFRAVRCYNANMATVMCIKENTVRLRVDETSGRAHTFLSSLNKGLRNFITYEGQALCAVDIISSQPTLLLTLLKPEFYQDLKEGTGTVNIHRVAPELMKNIPVDDIAKFVTNNREKFATYIEAVQDDLYAFLQPHFENGTGLEYDDRKKIKEGVFCVLYSDNRFFGQKQAATKRIFKNIFPEIYAVLAAYKKNGTSNLPVLLQKLETRLVLDGAAKKLSKALPGAPIFTIHDSIVMPTGNKELISNTLKSEAQRILGITVKTRPELWLPENCKLKGEEAPLVLQ